MSLISSCFSIFGLLQSSCSFRYIIINKPYAKHNWLILFFSLTAGPLDVHGTHSWPAQS